MDRKTDDTIQSLHRERTDISRKRKLIYINENMRCMSKSDKKYLLQNVLNSMDKKYIETKGGGTQFITKHASDELINQMFYFVQNKMASVAKLTQANS